MARQQVCKFKWIMIALLAVCGLARIEAAGADQITHPFMKECSVYKSSAAFVRTASYYCVRQKRTGDCQREAEAYFKACRYEGSFVKMSQKEYSAMLFALMVGRAPQMVDTVAKR
jgi:hypothetical protein